MNTAAQHKFQTTEWFISVIVSEVRWNYLSNVSLHNSNWVNQNISGQFLNLLTESGTEQEGWEEKKVSELHEK